MVAQRLSNQGSSYWLFSRLIFPYDFKTNGMLLTAKAFCFLDKNLAIAPKKFRHFISKNETIRTV